MWVQEQVFNQVDVIDNHEVSLCLAKKWQVYSYQTRILPLAVCSQNVWDELNHDS